MKSLLLLIEDYAEARHRYGAPEYNSKSAEARKAVLERLGEVGLLEKPEQPELPEEQRHLSPAMRAIFEERTRLKKMLRLAAGMLPPDERHLPDTFRTYIPPHVTDTIRRIEVELLYLKLKMNCEY